MPVATAFFKRQRRPVRRLAPTTAVARLRINSSRHLQPPGSASRSRAMWVVNRRLKPIAPTLLASLCPAQPMTLSGALFPAENFQRRVVSVRNWPRYPRGMSKLSFPMKQPEHRRVDPSVPGLIAARCRRLQDNVTHWPG